MLLTQAAAQENTLRAGFKLAFSVLGLIKTSSKELSEEQMQILVEALDRHLNPPAPPPESPYPLPEQQS